MVFGHRPEATVKPSGAAKHTRGLLYYPAFLTSCIAFLTFTVILLSLLLSQNYLSEDAFKYRNRYAIPRLFIPVSYTHLSACPLPFR